LVSFCSAYQWVERVGNKCLGVHADGQTLVMDSVCPTATTHKWKMFSVFGSSIRTHSGRCLDSSTNPPRLADCNENKVSQRWSTRRYGAYHVIINPATKNCLEVTTAGQMTVAPCSRINTAQHFTLPSTPTDPVYHPTAIPVTPNANNAAIYSIFLQAGGSGWTVGESRLYVDQYGTLTLVHNGKIAWSTPKLSNTPIPNKGLFMHTDGNLCIGDMVAASIWCAKTANKGATHFHLLPPGSYGRAWGIVLQNAAGKVVWSKFGPSIHSDGPYNLIPGTFLDGNSQYGPNALYETQHITNGENTLIMNQGGVLAFGTPNVQYFTSSEPGSIPGPYFFLLNGGNGCARSYSGDVPGSRYWCLAPADFTGRYLAIAQLDSGWGLVLQDEDLNIIWAKVQKPTQSSDYLNEPNQWTDTRKSSSVIIWLHQNGNMEAENLLTGITKELVGPQPSTIVGLCSEEINGQVYIYNSPLPITYRGIWSDGSFVLNGYYNAASPCYGETCVICNTINGNYYSLTPNAQSTGGKNILMASPGYPEIWIINSIGVLVYSYRL